MRIYIRACVLFVATLLLGCKEEDQTYTLYRNSPLNHTMRVHWATFNANESPTYNEGNCLLAAEALYLNYRRKMMEEAGMPPPRFWGQEKDTFPNVPDTPIRWWCEPGKYKE